jgi:hypothetical protein
MHASREYVRVQVQLQDILALVVGYGMAALLFRAFWPARRPSSFLGLPGAGLYLWLGLAMSGPIVMLRRRLSRGAAGLRDPRSEGIAPHSARLPSGTATPGPRDDPMLQAAGATWAELAWLLIGAYWIVLGVIVIPSRLNEFKLGDVILFGMAPVVVAVGLCLFGRGSSRGRDVVRGWTHTAAIVLLSTWPLAWICLIVLGGSLR